MENGGGQGEARAALKPVLANQHIHATAATDSTPKGAQLPHSITITVTVSYPLGHAAHCGVRLGGQGGLTGCSGLRPGNTAVMLSCIRVHVTTCALTPCPQPAYCSIACPGGNASMLHDKVHPCACGLACSESSHRLNCQDLNLARRLRPKQPVLLLQWPSPVHDKDHAAGPALLPCQNTTKAAGFQGVCHVYCQSSMSSNGSSAARSN
jgi:hypothetical protein